MKLTSKKSPSSSVTTVAAPKAKAKQDKLARAFRAARNLQKALGSFESRVQWAVEYANDNNPNKDTKHIISLARINAVLLAISDVETSRALDAITELQAAGYSPVSKSAGKKEKAEFAPGARVWIKGLGDDEATEVFGVSELYLDRISSSGKLIVRAGDRSTSGVAKVVGIYARTKLSLHAPKEVAAS